MTISVYDYMKQKENLSYKKKKLVETINEMRLLHATYRDAFRKYKELKEKKELQIKELIEMIE